MRFADESRGRPYSKDPAVVRFKGVYTLYYSLPPAAPSVAGPTTWTIGIARSNDLEHWEKVGEILPEAPYESKGLCAPGAIVLAGHVHLFYQTYGNGPNDALCHAVSEDGLHFTRNATNPIFKPTGAWNVGRAIDADVMPIGDRLLLYFATRDPTMTTQMLGVAAASLHSDFGRSQWVQVCAAPILKPELDWEKQCIEAPAVCSHEGRYFMFYAGGYNNEPQQIGCAVSDDGLTWTRLFDEPLLPNGGPGDWNASESGHPYVWVDDDGRTYLFFQGNHDHGQTWYLSKCEIGWRDGLPFLKNR
ncbi:MAG: family 43 glycosylhydrolase [Anaerolineae bacterium]|nr:family 43 glycosylhydrolase [Anaerolineae bacterium]